VAFQLMFTVLGVLAQSVGTAVFPSLSLLGGRGDMDGFRQTLTGALRSVLFMSIPASVGMFVLAVPIVSTISERGQWTAEDTAKTAWALQFFAVGLAGFALQEVLARAFYALRDTATPVRIAVGGMMLNVILSLILIRVVQGQGPFGGLALANSLATMVESLALWVFLRRRANGLNERNVLDMTARTLIASLVMGVVVYAIAKQFVGLSGPILLVVGAVIGAGVFEVAALLLGIAEARSMPGTLLGRVRR
jgi:putative peptidoglycan lipid II flippase